MTNTNPTDFGDQPALETEDLDRQERDGVEPDSGENGEGE